MTAGTTASNAGDAGRGDRMGRTSKRVAATMLAVYCATCYASRPPRILDAGQWARALDARGVDPSSIVHPLRYDEAMRSAASALAGEGLAIERLQALQRGLFDPARFPFRYDSDVTLTAEEAFRVRAGNCLSFTSLFLALSRSIGIPAVAAARVGFPEPERSGDLVLLNSHVVAVLEQAGGIAVFDFERTPQTRPAGIRVLSDLELTALYLNNLGVETLRSGALERSIRLFEQATRLDPTSAGAWSNLGVARRRGGDPEGALESYHRGLLESPRDPTVLGNVAALHRSLGKTAEAERALAAIRVPDASPHLLVVRADLAMAQGDPGTAASLCRRACRAAPSFLDGWLCRARTELARGNRKAARRALDRALALAPGDADAARLREGIERARP